MIKWITKWRWQKNQGQIANVDDHVGRNGLQFGKFLLPEAEGTNHFAAIGSTGSGKTTILRLLAQSVLPQIGTGDCRALFYDAKQDAMPLLAGIMDIERIKTLNPFDSRGCYWDLSTDLDEPRVIEEFTYNLIPEVQESQPFFTEASRALLYGVMLSYFLSGYKYRFADVLRPLRSRHMLYQILTKHAATRHFVENYLQNPRLVSNLAPSIAVKIQPFESIAACWSHSAEGIAIRDWAQSEFALVLGNSEVSRHTIDSINRCIFKRASDITLDREESDSSRTWFFLDELADAGKLNGLISLAKKGRSKGGCLAIAFQSVSGLRDSRLYGQQGCDELLGQIGTRFIGRLECTTTAEYISNLIGDQKYVECSRSYTYGKESTSTRSYNIQVRKAYLPSTFLDITPCDDRNGLTGYCVTRALGTFMTRIDGDLLFNQMLKPKNKDVKAFEKRPAMHQILEPWTADEARQFGVDIHFRIPKKGTTNSSKGLPKKSKRKVLSALADDPLEDIFSE
jgi:type IV secretory pathway TraG/TraD family ATPase VirD4